MCTLVNLFNRFCRLIIILLIGKSTLFSQSCKVPFSISFSERTTNSIRIKWFDSNALPLGWEIEIVKKGQLRTGFPTSPLITTKDFTLENLSPSTSYELYIRTVCSLNSSSAWNVAIPFITVLEIPVQCGTSIPLKDNGTEILLLDVKQGGILGKDVFLDGVDIIVEHDWPADLKLTLESPQGQQLVLTNHNGTVTDDFGDISDTLCKKVTTFAPQACSLLKNNKPPFIGTFRMDGEISGWKPDTLSRGYWKLICYDRAAKDVGTLKYINIRFNTINCLIPENFVVSKSDINALTVSWKSLINCNTVKLSLFKNGNIVNTYFVECKAEKFIIDNLIPNEKYELTISSVCSLTSQSQESCILSASTTCETVTMSESFDGYQICPAGCAANCTISSGLWFNSTTDGDQDWIIFKGKTDTENTGPSGDINGTGNYIYIENNPTLCKSDTKVILQSKCINIKSNESGCDMSFFYHLYGADIATLKLEISTDNGITWEELFYVSGNQGDVWNRMTLSLKKYDNSTGIFRFTGTTAFSSLGDIALDQIEFYKSTENFSLFTYFIDKDGDGFGAESEKIEICSINPPKGYVRNSGDCNDGDKNIYPGAIEIPCNGIDENCNGNSDDQPAVNPIKMSSNILDASCNGSSDGSISLNISGGNPPYQVKWNNGEEGLQLTNTKPGVYYATITDVGSCVVNTNFYEVKTKISLNVISTAKTDASCLGKSDGSIFIEHSLGNEPYKYFWSDKSSEKNLINAPPGTYTITVTDNRNCSAELGAIIIQAKPKIVSDILEIKNPLCFGQSTGNVRLISFNGSAPYYYKWSTGSTFDSIANVTSGNYTSTITDNVGCQNIIKIEIKSPPPLTGKLLSTENVRCFGEQNGSIKTDVSGGFSPYTYLWNNFNNTDDIFGLKAGQYTLTVTDANGCKVNFQAVEIKEPSILDVKIDSIKAATCILGKNGFVKLKAFGGNDNYNYAWSHSEKSVNAFSDLVSGNYSVTLYDKLGCKATLPNIYIPYLNNDVPITLISINDNKCYKEKNGIISLQTDGINKPFDYNWSFGLQYFSDLTRDTIKFLPAGSYKVTVTDNQGCTGISNLITLQEKPPYFYTVTTVKNNTCSKDSLGNIKIEITGGSPPFGILWNGGLYAGRDISQLHNDVYSGFISDSKGCTLDILPLSISSVSDIKLNPQITPDNNRSGSGKICVNPGGGVSPYQIFWEAQNKTATCLENLFPGLYSVSVKDALDCQIAMSFLVENISSVDEITKSKVILFPNPSYDLIHLISEESIMSLSLYAHDGQFIENIPVAEDKEVIFNSLHLIPGIYILKLHSGRDIRYLRFIKL